jgi:hypothetical protein
LHTIKRRKVTELVTACVETALKHVTVGKREGRTEVILRRGRRRKQLLDDLKEKRGYRMLREEAPDCIVWRNHFGRSYGSFIRLTTD